MNAKTEKQIEKFKKWKIPFPEGITKGEASEMLAIEIERRAAKNKASATPKQLYHIRAKLGRSVPDNLSFGEARQIIAESQKMGVA